MYDAHVIGPTYPCGLNYYAHKGFVPDIWFMDPKALTHFNLSDAGYMEIHDRLRKMKGPLRYAGHSCEEMTSIQIVTLKAFRVHAMGNGCNWYYDARSIRSQQPAPWEVNFCHVACDWGCG